MDRLRQNPLARNWAWSVADEGFVLVSAVVSVFLLIPRLGAANYGAWAALFALLGPCSAIAHAGIRLTILEGLVRDGQNVVSVSRSCITLALLISGALAPIVAIGGMLSIKTLPLELLMIFAVSELIVGALINSFLSIVQGVHSYAKGVQLRLGISASRILVLLLLVAVNAVSIEHLILANASMLLLAAPLVYLATRQLGLRQLLPGRIQPGHLGTTIVYGLGIGSSIVQNDSDKVVLNAFGYQKDSGVYAAGYRLVSMLMIPLAAFLSSSHFAVLEAARSSSDQLRKAVIFTGVTMIYAIPAIGGLVLVAPLVPMVLGSEFEGSSLIMQLVAPVAVIKYVGGFACNGLLGLNRNGLRMWLLVSGAVFSVALYILLVPEYSWRGALVGTLISEIALAIGCWVSLYWCQKKAESDVPSSAGGE